MSHTPQNTAVTVITLTDGEGVERNFAHVMTFEHLDVEYMALEIVEENQELEIDEDAETEICIFKVIKGKDDADMRVEEIENDILLQELFETFLAILDEEEDEEAQK